MLKYHKMDTCVNRVKQIKYNITMRSYATEIICNKKYNNNKKQLKQVEVSL